eukprot:13670255-Alexandrium_andersonii.AAC.1
MPLRLVWMVYKPAGECCDVRKCVAKELLALPRDASSGTPGKIAQCCEWELEECASTGALHPDVWR